MFVVWGETDKTASDIQARPFLARIVERITKLREKHEWAIEKPQLDNARRLRGIYFIDPEDKEFKETIRNARKKLEMPMAPDMPCKTSKKSKHGDVRPMISNQKFACILEASESTRGPYCKKRDNSLQHYNLIHKLIPVPQTMKIPKAKAAVDKEWEKTWKDTDMEADESQKQKRDDRWSKICHLKNARNTKAESYSEVTLWKMIQVLTNIYRAKIISITNDSSKSHGRHSKAARIRRTSSRRNISLHPGQNGRCSKIIENPISECPDIWIRLPRHKWPKSWSNIEDQDVPLERNLHNHPLAGLFLEKQFEKVSENTVGKKFPIVNAYSHTEKKGYSYLCMWTT